MESKYYGIWVESKEQGLIDDFQITKNDLDGVEILLACYFLEGYYGEAYVLFKKDNRLFEVHGSHCSCGNGGLDSQWEPEETTIEYIKDSIERTDEIYNDYLDSILKELK